MGGIQSNNYKLDEGYVRQVAQSGQDMVESVKFAAQQSMAAESKQKDILQEEDVGCSLKRGAKTDLKKKRKSIFSLQALLSKDIEAPVVAAKGKGSKSKKKVVVDDELQCFIREQLEVKKRFKASKMQDIASPAE